MTPEQAARLAQATFDAIEADEAWFFEWFGRRPPCDSPREKHWRLDRERVASDLRSYTNALTLADRYGSTGVRMLAADALNGLRRTALLYGVDCRATVEDPTARSPR